ncbi:MAG: hypothetical protein A2156_13585 [Deltaproteobacteria bacterium RBG_16_48_10]|nr:MAG: hypothetical protein A2156_13585 [Deltaproteobacteria bacterium RBG_16_48_10]
MKTLSVNILLIQLIEKNKKIYLFGRRFFGLEKRKVHSRNSHPRTALFIGSGYPKIVVSKFGRPKNQ